MVTKWPQDTKIQTASGKQRETYDLCRRDGQTSNERVCESSESGHDTISDHLSDCQLHLV